MTVQQTLRKLESLGDEKTRARHRKNGAGDNLFGAKMGDIRALAKELKGNHALALELWETENLDARLLAILLLKPKDLTPDDVDRLVRSEPFHWAADWLTNYIVKKHPDKESLRESWMTDDHPMAARAGWSLTAERITQGAEGLDLSALLKRIESEMADAPPDVQWTMNMALVEIGIHFPKHRKRALAIGENLGIYRDYPERKGCTSPFAPIWINEMVSRQK